MRSVNDDLTGKSSRCVFHLFRCVSASLRETMIVVAAVAWLFAGGQGRAENWDRFRGPNGAGQSDAAIPSQWSAANLLWKRPLAGVGHSSPVVWGDHVFVTSGDAQAGDVFVEAFDAAHGEPLWQRQFPGTTYKLHAFNSYASSTPAADADRLYLVRRDGDRLKILALTHGGDLSWQADAGRCDEQHGYGSSPVVVDDLVCLENDNESAGELIAFDRHSGAVRWRLPRPPGVTSFSTPCLLDPSADDKLLLVASSGAGLTAVDAATGRVAWQALPRDLPQRCVASPIVAGEMVFVSCGQGGSGLHLIALRPPSGDRPAHEEYRLRQGIPQVPTAVAAGQLLFLWHDRGTVSCIDVATGSQHWRERVGGNCHGSPIRVGDRIFCVTLSGDVIVLAAEPKFQLLARNSLDEPSRATPAVANNRMYVRTESSLVCIGEAAK